MPYEHLVDTGSLSPAPLLALTTFGTRYAWTKNEIDFQPSGNKARIVKLPNSGTLVFNSPKDEDEGLYQCLAYNSFGRSATVKINMREARLDPFPISDEVTHRPELGKSLTLTCVPPDSIPQPQVVWIVDQRLGGFSVINYDARVTMDREYRLRFANVIESDGMDGMPYRCLAINSVMRLNRQGPPQIVIPRGRSDYTETNYLWADQDDRAGLRGETLSIMCIFSGNPTPDVHWERTDGSPLPDNARTRKFGQELVFDKLQYDNAGNYDCWASNIISQARKIRTFSIRVNSAAYFTEEPQDVEIGVGGDAEFRCSADGSPKPDIAWFINGESLDTAMVTDKRLADPNKFSSPETGKLYFTNVAKTDYMVIQCNASNIHGYVFSDVYLNILEEAPTIIDPPEAISVSAEGTSVNVTCRTTGKPDPIITWFKDEQQITGGRYRILPSGSLNIAAVVLADAGQFVCQASNKFGLETAGGVLVVRRKTRIEKMPKDLEVFAGSDAKFTCSGTTDPEEVQNLRIVWLKDGKEITTNDQRMTTNIQDSSLTISGTITRDSGTYTCIATNGLDDSRRSALLTVKDRPKPPTRVRHEFCDKNATIHWMPGSYNNAPLQYYVLQYNTSFNPDQWNFGLKVNASLVKVNMTLSPFVTYNFRLIAYNKMGASEPSFPSPKPCITTSDIPEYHPQNLRTIGHQPGKLYIEWTPVPQLLQNGPGFRYMLEIVREADQAETSVPITITDWRTDHYEISAQNVYEAYRITLRAENDDGPAKGDPPTITGYSYEQVPQISPTNVQVESTGDTFAKLVWDFPKSEIGKPGTRIRGEFRGFKVQFWERGRRPLTAREVDFEPDEIESLSGDTFRATVNKITPFTNMEAQVAVRNNFYIGQPSEIVRFLTEPGLPGVVEFLRVLNVGDTHVNLEWASPLENRGNLIGYDISYRKVRGLDLDVMQDREPQINDPYTTTAYVSGLSPNTKYRIYIYARTEQGRGEAYFIEIVTAKPGTPRMPRFTIENVGRTFINVSWWINAFTDSGTVVFVEYRKLYGAEWLRTTDEVVNTWKNVSNLEPGTTYELRIKATNGKISVASGIDEITTDGNAKAYDLVSNIGWFLGMLFSVLFIIGFLIFLVLLYRSGFRFTPVTSGGTGARHNMEPYSGSYDNTARVAAGKDFGPEPKGYSNDYYDDKDYHNYEYDDDNGGFDRRPPSYSSDMSKKGSNGVKRRSDEYEDFDRQGDNYYDRGEPSKFDRYGAPRDDYNDDNRDDYRGDYQDDYRDDDRYDYRDDYRNDYDDGRYDDGYYQDDRRDYYSDDDRAQPSAPPSASTFV
ncbi:neural cell adhesion molecule L1-like protein [Elysia marginata]|uniref:Neural cell adhesion molecule L1-like protein n=1 Tax=Elysia marginata TaxID=1093978 RepID=A0AAV4JNB6_9GAST|nr:neural cell adhesion molecule L1-like protein [Elysia marginata]